VVGFKAFLFQCFFNCLVDCRNLSGAFTAADDKVAGEAADTVYIKQDDVRCLFIAGSFYCFPCYFYPYQNMTSAGDLFIQYYTTTKLIGGIGFKNPVPFPAGRDCFALLAMTAG